MTDKTIKGIGLYTYSIGTGEADAAQACRISAFLEFFQDVADKHARVMGFHRDDLLGKYGCTWVAVRTKITLNRPVRYEEQLTIRTCPRLVKGAMVYRDFDVFVGDEHVGEAVTVWALADFEKRTVVRPTGIPELVDAPYAPAEMQKDSRLGKLMPPKEKMQLLERVIVRYSDLDVNGHCNNVKYADMVCNAADLGHHLDRFVSEFQIDYIKECRLGDVLDLWGEADENGSFVTGKDENGEVRFRCRLTLTERKN